MKRISALILGLLLTAVFTLPAWAGTLTTNKFLYKPSLGARGDTEKKTFDASLDRIDARLGKEIWVGDPNYGTTLQDAITAIGDTQAVLRIPAGAHAITAPLVSPANLTLQFEDGAFLDLSSLPQTDIQGLSCANPCVVTWTGHGLSTGNVVSFSGITQYWDRTTVDADSAAGQPVLNVAATTHFSTSSPYNTIIIGKGTAREETKTIQSVQAGVSLTLTTNLTYTHSASDADTVMMSTEQSWGEWMNLNFKPYSITKINDNSFSIGVDTSGYVPYAPATDPGKVNACIEVKGQIKANKTKTFNYTGNHAPVYFNPTYSPQEDLHPEWFGAAGDQSTDDLQAFNQAIGTAKLMSRGVIHLSRKYKLSDTWSINDINSQKIIVRGQGAKKTGIISFANTYPAIELVGAWEAILENFGITGNTSGAAPASNVPSVAIAIGRSKAWSTGGAHHFKEIYIDGYYQYGEIFILNGSMNSFEHIYSYTLIPNAPLNNRKFCVGIMHDNTYSLAPRNTVFSTWTSAGVDDNYFEKCQFTGGASASIPADCAGYLLQKNLSAVFRDVYSQGITNANSDLFTLIDGGNLSAYFCPIESTHRYTFNISSTAPTTYIADITTIDVRGSSAPTAIIKSDANSTLKRCFFLGGSYNSKIDLGGGSYYSTFRGFNSLVSFSSGGTFIGNTVEIPDSATSFDLSTATNVRNNIITDLRYTGARTTIDGDLCVGQPSFVTPNVLTLNTYKMTWAAAAPTTGSWKQGSIIWNTGAAAGGSPGWVCILDNTFGTLNGGATTGSITTGTKLLTVNSVTGLTIGNFIDVVADGGGNAVTAGRIVNINTTTKLVTLAANASATATNQAVSFHNHTTADAFKAMANLQ